MTSTYRQGHTAAVLQGHSTRNALNTCAYFTHLLKPDFHILDAGCGPGSITKSLAELVPRGRVVGIDSSEDVVKVASKPEGLPSNCTFQVADLESLPFADDTFDVVQTSQVLVHIPNRIHAFKELRRVCKPGGFVACREGDAEATMIYPMNPGIEKWSIALVEGARRQNAHPQGGRLLFKWAVDAGFAASNITYSLGSLTYSGEERKWWGPNISERVGKDETWRKRSIQAGVGSEEDFKVMQEGWEAWTADEAAVFVCPCGQVVCYK